MIYNIKYTKVWDRIDVLNFLQQKKINNYSIIDIGFNYNSWANNLITAGVDLFNNKNDSIKMFEGDINLPWVWQEIIEYVEKNGKFDFCICTHTLEDLANPQLSIIMMPQISKAGFVATPSKYAELLVNPYFNYKQRGSAHHRWIFNKENDEIIIYPKLGFLEVEMEIDCNKIANKYTEDNNELQFWWKDSLEIKTINDNYLGPTIEDIFIYYKNLFKD